MQVIVSDTGRFVIIRALGIVLGDSIFCLCAGCVVLVPESLKELWHKQASGI